MKINFTQKCPLVILFSFIFFNNLCGQSVGIGTATIEPSAKLQVESTNQGVLYPRLTTNQRDSIFNPAAGLTIYNKTINCLEFFNSVQWVSLCAPSQTVCYQSCLMIKQANINAVNGIYRIDPDCSGPIPEMDCYCDMTTDGGGWTLVLNYLHGSNTTPILKVLNDSLPLQGGVNLGMDESNTLYWGHTSNTLLNILSYSELRFYAKTSAHNRIIHFKTNHIASINYFNTGNGSCSGIESSFTPLISHSAQLPGNAVAFNNNEGDYAMCYFPFFTICGNHWSISFNANLGANTRWDVDNCTHFAGCSMCTINFIPDTHHQVWIR